MESKNYTSDDLLQEKHYTEELKIECEVIYLELINVLKIWTLGLKKWLDLNHFILIPINYSHNIGEITTTQRLEIFTCIPTSGKPKYQGI